MTGVDGGGGGATEMVINVIAQHLFFQARRDHFDLHKAEPRKRSIVSVNCVIY